MQKTHTLFASLLIATTLFAGCTQQPQASSSEPIRLGWVAPLTGDIARLGSDALTSAQIAIDDINAAGGVQGRQLDLVVEDGKCKPKEGAEAGNKLINTDHVPVVFAMCSPEVVAIAPTANNTHTVLLSSCASAPHITDAGDYVFRSYPSDAFQGVFTAAYVYNTLGKRRAAILAMQNDWGIGLQEVFQKRFEELGGTVVLVEKVGQDDRDVRTQLTKVAAADVDVLYFPSFTELGIAGLRQAQELDVHTTIVGGDAWGDPLLRESGVADGVYYVTPAARYKDWWKTEMEKRGATATVCAPAAYDNVKIIADIIGRVGDDGQKIKEELYRVHEYDAINGKISFDEHGDLETAAYDVNKVEGEQEVLISR